MLKTSFQEDVKRIRVKIDSLFRKTRKIGQTSRYLSLAITELEGSKMWLGKLLQFTGAENPYPNSMNASNDKIEPTADTSTDADSLWKTDDANTTTKRIKSLRQEIENIVEWVEQELFTTISSGEVSYSRIAIENVYTRLVDAKMWLGMELGEIMKEQEN